MNEEEPAKPGSRRRMPDRKVEVLRLGHRPDRDKRITTHVSLVARAFGSKKISIDRKDEKLEGTIRRVVEQFGGDFAIKSGVSRRSVLNKWNGVIVHLTMYGEPVDEAVDLIPTDDDVLVVVGAEKVPREIYDLAHFNVSVTNQPHSEVSSLAIFLDRLFGGKQMRMEHAGGKMRIIPDNSGKRVELHGDNNLEEKENETHHFDRFPDVDQALELIREVGCSSPVEDHVKEVYSLGMDMIRRSRENGTGSVEELDLDLLKAGLILHDIGRSRTHSINHITEGVKIARELSFDERLVGIIHNHIGAGITAREAAKLGLPEEDHIPLTWEEKIVCHADSLVENRSRRTLSEAVEKLRSKGAQKGAERMENLHLELENFLGIDIDELLEN